MDKELEDKLRGYLEEQKTTDVNGALHKIFNAFTEHEAKDEIRHHELRGDYRGLSLRVGELERDRDKLERTVEDTGRHEIVNLRADNKELRAHKWKLWDYVGAALAAAFAATITWLLGKVRQ